ncbi:hypothetical protein HYS48_01485 [Candidatus Woesearchaeota archaeon]|nr:hypothetical protein [Candidatus Woesearchaeota archaeon]
MAKKVVSLATIAETYGISTIAIGREAMKIQALEANKIPYDRVEDVLNALGLLSDQQVRQIVGKKRTAGDAMTIAVEIGKRFSEPPSYQIWEATRKESDQSLPKGREIINTTGSWQSFLEQCGHTIAKRPDIDTELERKIAEQLWQRTGIWEISRNLKLRKEVIEGYCVKAGVLGPEEIRKRHSTLDALLTTPFPQAVFWEGDNKAKVREEMLDLVQQHLDNPNQLHYLGLPAANFIDYILLAKKYGIVEGLAAEQDFHTANIMRSILTHFYSIQGGELLKPLTFVPGSLFEALQQHPEMKFNVANLDYQGAWSQEKVDTLRLLFERNQWDTEAVLFITLNDSPRERSRMWSGRDAKVYGTDSNILELRRLLDALAEQHGYVYSRIAQIRYRDGNDEMVTSGYHIASTVRVDKVVEKAFNELDLEPETPITVTPFWATRMLGGCFVYRIMNRAEQKPLEEAGRVLYFPVRGYGREQQGELYRAMEQCVAALNTGGYNAKFTPIDQPPSSIPLLMTNGWTGPGRRPIPPKQV